MFKAVLKGSGLGLFIGGILESWISFELGFPWYATMLFIIAIIVGGYIYIKASK